MLIKNFIHITKLINIAYYHKKNHVKIQYKPQINILIKYLYRYNYIKYIKYSNINQQLIVYINYYNNNNINFKIKFFKTKQHISINYVYLSRLNYNYLISISNKNKENLVDKSTAIKHHNNGRLIALLY